MEELSVPKFENIIKDFLAENASILEDLLAEKYKEKFIVRSIGNILNYPERDKIEAYCSPKCNERIIFKAVMDKSHVLESDNYVAMTASYCFEEAFYALIKAEDLKATFKVSLFSLSSVPETINIKEVLDKNEDLSVFVRIVIDNTVKPNEIYELIDKYFQEYEFGEKNSIVSTVWMIDQMDYEKCATEIKNSYSVNKVYLDQFNLLGEGNLQRNAQGFNVDKMAFGLNFEEE